MSPLRSLRVEPGATVGAGRVRAVVEEEWGIVFAQGGIVTAAMVEAATRVLDRPDLRLTDAAATFCRPVPCGPVTMDVAVLRSGRTGAQVHVTLWADGEEDDPPNAVVTVVCAVDAEGWPERSGITVPPELTRLPSVADPRLGVDAAGGGVAFFRHTDWRLTPAQPAEPFRRTAWFAFVEPPLLDDGTWVPAMLAVPADALGLAAVPPIVDETGPLTAPSLQLTIQVAAPVRGEWLGIDTTCFHVGGAIASGVTTLWDAAGRFVGSATQTAALRRV